MVFHNWVIPISITIVLGAFADKAEELMFVGYFSLFGLFYLIGNLDFFNEQKTRNSGYRTIGSLGSIILLLILSFDDFWEDLRRKYFLFSEMLSTPEFFVSAAISILAGVLLYLYQKNKPWNDIKPLAPMFILFIVAFFIGLSFPFAVILINFYVFALGILTIREGAKQNHLGVLNYGLIIITALVICRFFDTNLSFVVRGILFVSVGVGFFATNYWMLKKRKTNEQ